MKKILLPVFMGLMCTSFTVIPAAPPVNEQPVFTVSPFVRFAYTYTPEQVYNNAHLEKHGLSREAFEYAWKGYQILLNRRAITRDTYLTICDFSQSSREKRLYIIDMENRELITNTYVAHGKNSGAEYASRFSNKNESLQSSLGFYITANTYIGKHGLSLRLKGVDPGFNDKAMQRTIVIHGAAYVDPARARAGMYMGRSWGCPAVPQRESTEIIRTIQGGTCLFVYHPSDHYLKNSTILND